MWRTPDLSGVRIDPWRLHDPNLVNELLICVLQDSRPTILLYLEKEGLTTSIYPYDQQSRFLWLPSCYDIFVRMCI
jgi:hypothetical protein